MSFLAWAFGLGALAIGFPLLLHLIRPTPRGRQPFSSLMFLKTSPPRITRRTKLDNLLLLLLRCAVVILIAMAFMRPFFRSGAKLFSDNLVGRRVAILVDTSASMQRAGLWQQAKSQVNAALDALDAGDDVALFSFDGQFQTRVGFDSDVALPQEQKKQLILGKLNETGPGHGTSNLGDALIATAEMLNEINDRLQSAAAPQIILISDLQSGANISGLQAYSWPKEIPVKVLPVVVANPTNASVRLLAEKPGQPTDDAPRVRVFNANNSVDDQFYVFWANVEGPIESTQTAFYVAPGASRVLRMPRVESTSDVNRLILSGDDATFDNEFHIAPIKRRTSLVAYFGNDQAGDAEGMLYFLKRVFVETRKSKNDIQEFKSTDRVDWIPGQLPDLVVVAEGISDNQQQEIQAYVQRGGTALMVLENESMVKTLGDLVAAKPKSSGNQDQSQVRVDDYRMFAEIDFTHPLFVPLASPRYNDFTKIRFWKHLPMSLDENDDVVHVIARFDNNEPALWQRRYGQGSVYCLTSGWHPQASQLALSTKFVPLMNGLLKLAVGRSEVSQGVTVGQPINVKDLLGDSLIEENHWSVLQPDDSRQILSDEMTSIDATMPGIIQIDSAELNEEYKIAVNLTGRESQTAPMNVEQLEALGVQLGTQPDQSQQLAGLQNIKNAELENRQRIWKWLIVSALVLLIVETLVAGRASKKTVIRNPDREAAVT